MKSASSNLELILRAWKEFFNTGYFTSSFPWLKKSFEKLSELSFEELIELREFLSKDPVYKRKAGIKNLFIAASTVPTTPLVESLYCSVLGSPLVCRIPRTFSLDLYLEFKKCFESFGVKLLDFAQWESSNEIITERFFDSVEFISVHGDDSTVKELAEIAELKRKKFIGFGHKASFIILDLQEKNSEEIYNKIYNDISLFKQLGCLSPQVLYIKANEQQTEALIQALGEKLSKINSWLTPSEAYAKKLFLERSLMLHNTQDIQLFYDSIIFSNSLNFDYSCGLGTLWIRNFCSYEELFFCIKKDINKDKVACIGTNIQNISNEMALLEKNFPDARICELGQMQLPSILPWQRPTVMLGL